MPYNYETRLEKRRKKRKARRELKAVVANAFALDEADRRAQAANSQKPRPQFNSQEPPDEPDESERESVAESSNESETEEKLEQELQEIVRAQVKYTRLILKKS